LDPKPNPKRIIWCAQCGKLAKPSCSIGADTLSMATVNRHPPVYHEG